MALIFSPSLLADDMFLDNEHLPQVLMASRLKQSPAAVPGSMTVIDSELIIATGARHISELLRLVPGMMVGNISGNQAAVNYHGTNATAARRLQVLIDGRSVYRAGLAHLSVHQRNKRWPIGCWRNGITVPGKHCVAISIRAPGNCATIWKCKTPSACPTVCDWSAV